MEEILIKYTEWLNTWAMPLQDVKIMAKENVNYYIESNNIDVNNWIDFDVIKPKNNEYVLVYTPFCKYKCAVAFFNGVNWRSADNTAEIWNVKWWQKLPETNNL